jgi:hypothetical protein
MKTRRQLIEDVHGAARAASACGPSPQSMGVFLREAVFGEKEDVVPGFFLWFVSREAWYEQFPLVCLYWTHDVVENLNPRRFVSEVKGHLSDYRRQDIDAETLVFRLNNLLMPTGIEVCWMGAFDTLLFGESEIPRRTRLFCRRILADMEEPGIDPLNDAPMEADYLNVYMECLGDFGLEGQGLDNPLPVSHAGLRGK